MLRLKIQCIRTLAIGIGFGMSVVCFGLMADSKELPELLNSSKYLIVHAIGNSDPALPRRLADRLNPDQLLAAFYHGSRTDRLVALDAAAVCTDEPFFLASSLVSLMGAADRQVASLSARALYSIVQSAVAQPGGFDDVVPKQAAQLVDRLRIIATDRRLDLDIRQIAIRTTTPLQLVSGTKDGDWALSMLDDDESAIRSQALGLLSLPLSQDAVSTVVRIATQDTALLTRGDAAVLLCENAVAHRVNEPSDDLVDLLQSTIQTPKMPIDVLGGILSCLSEFSGEKRDALLDLAIEHPDPAVKQYWKRLKTK